MTEEFNYENIQKTHLKIAEYARGFWRYRSVLSLPEQTEIVTLGETVTALSQLKINEFNCFLKHEYQLPTGSFKDRGAAVLISYAKFIGAEQIVEDSSGNAGASVAAYCARAEIPCRIYVPEATSLVKTRQIALYGAEIVRVTGNREKTAQAALSASKEAFYASHSRHPLFVDGVKTMIYEIWDQFAGNMPDTLILPVGNGSLLLGLYKGLCELVSSGRLAELPRIIGVQASQCAPLFNIFHGIKSKRQFGSTIAEGIAIPNPCQAERIVEAVKKSRGEIIEVSEREIENACKWAWEKGLCIEKTSATGIAGISRLSKTRSNDVLIVLTGHGLKAIQ